MNEKRVIEIFPSSLSVPLLETWEGLKRNKGLFLLYGHISVLHLSHWLLLKPLVRGEEVIILEGGNSFNPYLIAKGARALGQDPRSFLKRIKISRAFTCHQMLALVRKVREMGEELRSRIVLVSGLLTTFYDENVPRQEADQLFRETLANLEALVQEGMTVLVTVQELSVPLRKFHLDLLFSHAARVVKCIQDSLGKIILKLEKPKLLQAY